MICMITRMNIHLIRSFPRQKYEHVPCSTTVRFSISSGTVTTDRLIHRCCFSTKVHSFEEYLLGSFAKMVQFEMNRHVFPSLSLYPPSESTSEFRKFEYAIFGVSVLLFNLLAILVSWTFVLKYATIDLEQAILAIFQLPATANMSYVQQLTHIYRMSKYFHVEKKQQMNE